MIAIFVLATCQYSFAPSTPLTYAVAIEMSGTLPILGGKEGKATIEFDLRVTGLSQDAEKRTRAQYELLTFRTKMNGAVLPFGLSSVQDFFPKSDFIYSKTGLIFSTTAPKKSLPASMPGLDSQRLPETTFMPIEFGTGSSWIFERTFNGTKIRYSATSKPLTEAAEECVFSASQAVKSWEDESNRPTELKNQATFEVECQLSANGKVTFNSSRNCLIKSETTVLIEGDATHLESKVANHRKLTLKVVCTLK